MAAEGMFNPDFGTPMQKDEQESVVPKDQTWPASTSEKKQTTTNTDSIEVLLNVNSQDNRKFYTT